MLIPLAAGLEGGGLGPLLRDPAHGGKAKARSQHHHPSYGRATHMGYTVRPARHRYVEWRDLATREVFARELYDHASDPAKTVNRADDPPYADTVRSLGAEVARRADAAGGWPALAGTRPR